MQIECARFLLIKQVLGATSQCQLFKDHSSIIDDCVNWHPHNLQYTPQKPLRGHDFKALVCFAESPNLFYVHILDNNGISPYRNLRKSMEMFVSPVFRNPHVGSACVVKHIDKNVRGKIVEWVSTDHFKVQLVDFGLVEIFAEREIKISDKEFLKLPPLAIECCLKEFEGIKDVAQCEIKEFEKTVRKIPEFEMRIVKRDGNRYIVEVEDWNSSTTKAVNQQVNLNRSDWSEANTTIETHFQNRRNMKRKLADDSDDEVLWKTLDEMCLNSEETSDCKKQIYAFWDHFKTSSFS